MASSLIQPTPITVPWASVGNKRSIPIESQILEVGGDGKASYADGYPPLCGTPLVSGGKPPSILDENGILFETTSNLRFLLAGGIPKFNANMATAINGYPLGAVLQDNAGGDTYKSLVDGNSINFNTTPAAIGVSWEKLSTGNRPGHIYTANDWCWLDKPSGLILQWLTGAVASTAGVEATLPITFPNITLGLWGNINTTIIDDLIHNGWLGLSFINNSRVLSTSAYGNPNINIYAIGR